MIRSSPWRSVGCWIHQIHLCGQHPCYSSWGITHHQVHWCVHSLSGFFSVWHLVIPLSSHPAFLSQRTLLLNYIWDWCWEKRLRKSCSTVHHWKSILRWVFVVQIVTHPLTFLACRKLPSDLSPVVLEATLQRNAANLTLASQRLLDCFVNPDAANQLPFEVKFCTQPFIYHCSLIHTTFFRNAAFHISTCATRLGIDPLPLVGGLVILRSVIELGPCSLVRLTTLIFSSPRYLNPAIAVADHRGIILTKLEPEQRRKLILISKVLQVRA